MKRTRIQKFTVVVLILSITLLATVFPFQIHFENALSLEPESDYAIKIEFWRILFEPFLGPLLYANRSLYTLEELPLTLLWILILYVFFYGIGIFKLGVNRKKKSLALLANLPLLAGILFAVFVLILFVPLPNNTIVNNSKDTILVTTHAHTEFSHDGLISQENMWKWHKRNGFDAFFITDHTNHKKTWQFAQHQKEGKFPMDPLVMVGEEYSASNHMSLLGLNNSFETKGMADKAAIDSVHQLGGVVIINHWFDGKGKEKELYHELGVDGFEIENSGKDLYYDREIYEELRRFCEENELLMIGGLDFHGYGRLCSLYNGLVIPNWDNLDYNSKQRAVLDVLKNGPQEKIKILLYKDRPFYPKTNLFLRPFVNAVHYFRTLNLYQVFSWIFWLLLVQFLGKAIKRALVPPKTGLLILSIVSAFFLSGLTILYYFKGVAVQGYSDLYWEYSVVLGPIGLALCLYASGVTYFRFFKNSSKAISK